MLKLQKPTLLLLAILSFSGSVAFSKQGCLTYNFEYHGCTPDNKRCPVTEDQKRHNDPNHQNYWCTNLGGE